MSKWEKRAKEIISNEKKKHVAVYELGKRIYKKTHGFNPVNKELLRKEIMEICNSADLIDSLVSEVDFQPRFKQSNDESDQLITIYIEGDFNGSIKLETGGGTRNTNDGKIPIFYAWSTTSEVTSLKEQKLQEFYKQYKDSSVEKLIDLALENKYFLTYEDCYKNYEIWHKEPSQYGSSIKGELKFFDEQEDSHRYKEKYNNLKKLMDSSDIKKFAEEHLYAKEESYTYEWTEYKL
ncbi:hypothetical protein AF332_11750 [Sporosarcina globispora]|uniref:Uncharacterized protein n=1 Tax=Sporosarcina globispora TaxID=1459 RepID=A0A0M0GC55_SPOGL|nr:hypothetical protein [Sporosarcina globispora]KON87434.1 hypothetical protein AF332_11750 [Sporosarcina globispora]